MLIKVGYISDSTSFSLQHVRTQFISHKSSLKFPVFSLSEKGEFLCFPKLQKQGKSRRNCVACSGVEAGMGPSGPPPNNLSWVVAVAIAMVLPLIGYKWGPTLKKKVETVMQTTEDVAEAVEKVAAEVEKAAEDIAERLPEGGKLRGAVDFIERIAERTAKDAGAVDDFIDEIQDSEEKLESFIKPNTSLDESRNATIVKAEEEKTETTIESLRVEESKDESTIEIEDPK